MKGYRWMSEQYLLTIMLSVAIALVMMVIAVRNDSLNKIEKRKFVIAFIIVIVAMFAECGGMYLNGKTGTLRGLHTFIRATEHSLAPMVTIAFTGIICSNKKAAYLAPPLFVHAVLEYISCFTGFIFYVDDQNVYHHGICYWIYIAFYLVCSIYFIVQAWKSSDRYQNKNRIIIAVVLLYLIFGIGVGMLMSDAHTDYLCLTIDMILLYIYYTDIIDKTDALTGLLNRRSYEARIKNINQKAVILFFDIDNFKDINDFYGHASGDVCLKVVGRAIREIYAPFGYCYRTGGDEFCVFLTKNMHAVQHLNGRFYARMAIERKHDARIPHIAMGGVHFDPAKDHIDEVIKKADIRMYQNKQKEKDRRRS